VNLITNSHLFYALNQKIQTVIIII